MMLVDQGFAADKSWFGDAMSSPAPIPNDALVMLGGDWAPGAAATFGRRLAAYDSLRLITDVALADVPDRLGHQARLDILWLALAGPIAPALAARIAAEAQRMGAAIVCEVSEAALDAAFVAFGELPGSQFLMDAEPVDQIAALAAARASRDMAVADAANDLALEQIDRLQQEVARISAVLAALAERDHGMMPPSGPVSFSPMVRTAERSFRAELEMSALGVNRSAPVSSAMVRRMLRQRRMRDQFFPSEMFADPAWDMLLDLYAAQLEGHPVAVSSLCIAAAVPATTALRWIKTMTDGGLFERQADPRDGRRIFIGLAPQAASAMERYFAALAAMRD